MRCTDFSEYVAAHPALSQGRFRVCVLANMLCKSMRRGVAQFKRQIGYEIADQDLVSASATAKRASCCQCGKHRPGIPDRGRPLPISRLLVRTRCHHITQSRLADGQAGKIPCLTFYRSFIALLLQLLPVVAEIIYH